MYVHQLIKNANDTLKKISPRKLIKYLCTMIRNGRNPISNINIYVANLSVKTDACTMFSTKFLSKSGEVTNIWMRIGHKIILCPMSWKITFMECVGAYEPSLHFSLISCEL